MKRTFITILAIASVAALTACQSNKSQSVQTDETSTPATTEVMTEAPAQNAIQPIAPVPANAMPRVIVYKTKADYSNLVPVAMDDSKTKIVSYPDPRDVNLKKQPTQLADGYLLDNFGIGKNVVYTDYTYEAYMALEKVPSRDELMKHIVEYNPLTEYYTSDKEYNSNEGRTVEALNKVISEGFKQFKAAELK